MLDDLRRNAFSGLVVIKSSVTPQYLKNMIDTYSDLRIVYNPEFLTEKNALEDFKSQEHIILGCAEDSAFEKSKEVFSIVFPKAEYISSSYSEAESIKYFTNALLSTKVSFCNEFYEFCKNKNIDYNFVARTAHMDKRLGNSHWQVPGHDNDFGFGGHCFPKDINALIWAFKETDTNCEVLDAVWNKNLNVRKTHEWLSMDGRAIIKKENK